MDWTSAIASIITTRLFGCCISGDVTSKVSALEIYFNMSISLLLTGQGSIVPSAANSGLGTIDS